MFNPVIIIAVIIQSVVAKSSRIAGAIIGYVITTGILLWGISLYGEGNQIALFGIPLSEPIFFIACLVWYGFDTKEFLAARQGATNINQSETETSPTTSSKLRMPALGLLFLWIMTNVLANISWSPLYSLFNPTYDDSTFTVASIATGLSSGMIAGIFQWLLLIFIFPKFNRWLLALWIPASMLGWAIVSVIYALVTVPDGMDILISAVSGLTIGVLQWLILQKYSKAAFWWIPANLIDFVVASLLSQWIWENISDSTVDSSARSCTLIVKTRAKNQPGA
jgi:hypothetical protein